MTRKMLTDAERETVYLLGEALIPQHQRGPSADEAGLASTFIDQALQLRPDLLEDGSAQPEYGEGSLLDVVRARGPIYRPT